MGGGGREREAVTVSTRNSSSKQQQQGGAGVFVSSGCSRNEGTPRYISDATFSFLVVVSVSGFWVSGFGYFLEVNPPIWL